MINILLTARPVFRNEINHLQLILAFLGNLLTSADHHSCQHISRTLVQLPFHQNKCRLAGGKIAGKRAILRILVSPVHKGRRNHLHQHRLSSAVSKGQQRALPVKLKGLVTDSDGIVIVIQINQTNSIYFTQLPVPPALSSPAENDSDSADSSP